MGQMVITERTQDDVVIFIGEGYIVRKNNGHRNTSLFTAIIAWQNREVLLFYKYS